MIGIIFPSPSKPTTPGQWTVIAWTAIVLLALMGILAIYFTGRAATPEQVAELRRIGFWSLVLAAVVWIIRRLITR